MTKKNTLQHTNPYLRDLKVAKEMTERVVRDSCLMEGMTLPPRKKKSIRKKVSRRLKLKK